jgi:hypothetical protein
MAADERFHVGGAVNAGKIAVEHELGDTRRGFDLGLDSPRTIAGWTLAAESRLHEPAMHFEG